MTTSPITIETPSVGFDPPGVELLKADGHVHRQEAGPWFQNHPGIAAMVIAVSSVGVLVLQVLDTRASDAIALLYVLPIGLAAVTFGLLGGLAAAAGAYLAFGCFAVVSSAGQVGLEGWITCGAAMFLLGGLLGRASDEISRGQPPEARPRATTTDCGGANPPLPRRYRTERLNPPAR